MKPHKIVNGVTVHLTQEEIDRFEADNMQAENEMSQLEIQAQEENQKLANLRDKLAELLDVEIEDVSLILDK
jgi:2C-methyl-D-erythritol 2,4-cyclodiphosphate synthase